MPMEGNGRHDHDHWSEGLVEEMKRRGWLMAMVTTVTTGMRLGGRRLTATTTRSPCSGRSTVPQSGGENGENVVAVVETDPVPNGDDAADDPAIWVDRDDPSRSTVIGTDKDGGLGVYDLTGKELQYLPDGEMNNVDLRDGFMLDGVSVTIVTAGNRSDNTIAIYTVNAETRRLSKPRPAASHRSSRRTARACTEARRRASSTTSSRARTAGRAVGAVRRRRAWSTKTGAQPARRSEQLEGCVADDQLGRLYVGRRGSRDLALRRRARRR